MSQIRRVIVKGISNRTIQHLVFWALSFLVLSNILKVSAEITTIDLIYALVFHIPIILVVYVNLKVLFPLFWERQRFILYICLTIVLISIGAMFYILLFDRWIDYIFKGYYFIAYYGFWDISMYFTIYLVVSSLLHLARWWFRAQEMEKEKTLYELKALKSQINPHFLFNSLNSIYSLSRKGSEEVPEKIVRLSNLLRHIIYDAESNFVSLEKEVEMIENYIDLQNLRTKTEGRIHFEKKGKLDDKKVAPMLFLPFVENSFKHGIKGEKGGSVKIKLTVFQSSLLFEVENRVGEVATQSLPQSQGIGIDNVEKRLQLIYPGKHSLKLIHNKDTFKVVLKLELGE